MFDRCLTERRSAHAVLIGALLLLAFHSTDAKHGRPSVTDEEPGTIHGDPVTNHVKRLTIHGDPDPIHGAFAAEDRRPGPPLSVQTRLFYSPTAAPAGAGSWVIGLHELFFLFAEAGVTDHFTFVGGFSSIPGSDRQYYYCSSKLTALSTENLDLGAGVFCIWNRAGTPAFQPFGNATLHGATGEITIGLGWNIPPGRSPGGPDLSFGASVPLGAGIHFITDNRFTRSSGPSALSAGVRFFMDPVSAEIGLLLPQTGAERTFALFPWVSFAYIP